MNKIGVNYIGYFNEPCGLTEASISNVKALEFVGVNVNVVSYLFNHKRDVYNHQKKENAKKYPINIFHINIGTIKQFVKKTGKKQFKNRYNIAFWVWEFKEIPKDIIPYMSLFDEIWTASDFCVDIFSAKAPCPVISIPHPVQIPTSALSKRDLTLEEDTFNFLTIFDSHSAILRKNPFAVVKAFKKAFTQNEKATLIIKSIGLDDFPEEKQKLENILKENHNIRVINERISRQELTGLIENTDALVSLHRSEGFGLTLAEAMYFKKPVIATGYSGNMVFMNNENSFPIGYSLKPLKGSHGMLKKGFIAADANIEEAALKMRQVYKGENSIDIIENGQRFIKKELSYISIGNKMKEQLTNAKLPRNNNLLAELILKLKKI
ncbi:glycosyltransferase [Wenyingzhuangia marina]|uniref:Glycosyl transferases group 1 n=1 Tax=Wenyingzhuangia marina TaxID=1195760 RepID=A0A1M5WTH7_9FLAO|nr:glycosyltransferase [Wenyingzhuangia marina]GGF80435.1 glycoside hydrolase [Wenyingzhuangia marina]SHH90424.1 Glycosyl transferases group 1 [Wenyingzhuangia marina]